MSFLSRLLTPKSPPLGHLWQWVTETARAPHWYLRHGVADTVDGRFDMVALVTALVLIRLEADDLRQETADLTERFVEDMDGSLRDIGIGDMVIGKHVGRLVGALGGRLGAYRLALGADADPMALETALVRNVYRGDDVHTCAAGLAVDVRALKARIDAAAAADLLAGTLA